MNYSEINIGDKASLSKVFTDADVISFANISLDNNPVHLDKEYAKNTIFEKRIVHGFLVGSLISAVIAEKLPGSGSIFLYQNMNFLKPVFHNERITAEIEVIKKRKDKQLITLRTICFKDEKEIVIEGEALVKLV